MERALINVPSIPVADPNGDRLTVFEFVEGRFLRKSRRYELCTGEAVIPAESDTFRIVATGEELLRL